MRYEMSAATYKRIALNKMSEGEWRTTVIDMAHVLGWHILLNIPDRAYHALADLAKSDKSLIPTLAALRGWPDLFLGNPKLDMAVALELKTNTGQTKPWQKDKIAILAQSGIPVYVVRPRDHERLEQFLRTGVIPDDGIGTDGVATGNGAGRGVAAGDAAANRR